MVLDSDLFSLLFDVILSTEASFLNSNSYIIIICIIVSFVSLYFHYYIP